VCHTEIYSEWQASAHGKSWSDPLFQQRFKEMGRPDKCVSCHASKPINESSFSCGPVARKHNRHEGVSCITCHSQGHIVHGAGTNAKGAHSCTNKSFKTPELCAPCHSSSCLCFNDQRGGHARQLGDWVKSPYRTRASCQTCHMPARVGQTANLRHPSMSNKTIAAHSFPGSKDIDFIRRSIGFRIERQGTELLLSLVNEFAGHSLPASEGRTIFVRLVFLDEHNLEIQHRCETIDSKHCNRLRSGESRVYNYPLYDGWRRVKVSVLFRHHCGQPEKDWYLLHHRLFDLQMNYDVPPTGTVADVLRQQQKERKQREQYIGKPVKVDEWGRKIKDNQ